MKKIKLMEQLFRAKGTQTVECLKDGAKVNLILGSRTLANSALQVPARAAKGKGGQITLSKAVLAPAFTEIAKVCNDGTIVGTIDIDGKNYYFATDGERVLTNAPESVVGTRLTVYPLVAWFENQDDDMKDYRAIIKSGNLPTETQVWRFSDAFYYGYAIDHPEIEVYADTAIEIETQEDDEEDKETPAKPTPVSSYENILPWKSPSMESIPNDCSVQSALQGKYRLACNFGKVTEGNEEYDFSNDMIPLSFLEGYVDNPSYRSVLRQIVGSIGALVRTNGIEDENKGKSINEIIGDATIKNPMSILRNLFLVGEPGTGKTMLAQAIAATLGIPCCIIRLSALSEADTMTEEVRVTDEGFKSTKAKLYWYTKYGGIFVFDDMTNADPNTFFATVGGLLESPFQLQVGQKHINRHPMSMIFATANIGTEGSKSINEALLTRFPSPVFVSKLGEKEFKDCIKERAVRSSGVKLKNTDMKQLINWVYLVYTNVLSAVNQHNADIADRLITMRAAIALTERILNELGDGFVPDYTQDAIEVFANILYAAGEPDIRNVVANSIASTSITNIQNITL